jgi:hypothetical protein
MIRDSCESWYQEAPNSTVLAVPPIDTERIEHKREVALNLAGRVIEKKPDHPSALCEEDCIEPQRRPAGARVVTILLAQE